MLKKILRNPQALVGLLIILLIVLAAIFAPAIAPHNPEEMNTALKFAPSSSEYPLGTDQLGRCVFSRLIYGARYSIGISLPTLLVLAVIGLALGCLSACAGKWIDRLITVLCDIFIAFPTLAVALAVIGIMGNGVENVMIAVIIAMWAWFTRMVRSYAALEMGKDYILASRISGCSMPKLIFKHLIPNLLPQFLVYLSTGVASMILTVSGFAFLGVGLPSGTPEWGAMLNEARSNLYSHPEQLIYPGICIVLTAAGFNLFGEAIRDIISPEGSEKNAVKGRKSLRLSALKRRKAG